MLSPKQFYDKTMTAIIAASLVAVASLWIVTKSDCEVKLRFEMHPWPKVQIDKALCLPPNLK